MEQAKLLPPKFSHSLKDLTSFLGIFEVTEDEIKRQKDATSETSSNLSHVTQGMFKKTGRNELEVVHEKNGSSDSEESEKGGGSEQDEEVHATTVGQIIKQSVQDYLGGSQGAQANESNSAAIAAENSYTEGPITKDNLSGKKAKLNHARQYSISEEKEKSISREEIRVAPQSQTTIMPPIKSALPAQSSQNPRSPVNQASNPF